MGGVTYLAQGHSMDRRRFLASALGGGLALAMAGVKAGPSSARELRFHHTHTDETLTVEYHDGRRYLVDALREVSHYLRDFRTGEVHPIDPGVLDILYLLSQRTLGHSARFHVISGYRSPKTNAMLRQKSHGVAKRSLHMQGKAIDITLPGCDTRHLYQAALNLGRGGVGFYAKSDFIHVDTGRVRSWQG